MVRVLETRSTLDVLIESIERIGERSELPTCRDKYQMNSEGTAALDYIGRGDYRQQ